MIYSHTHTKRNNQENLDPGPCSLADRAILVLGLERLRVCVQGSQDRHVHHLVSWTLARPLGKVQHGREAPRRAGPQGEATHGWGPVTAWFVVAHSPPGE